MVKITKLHFPNMHVYIKFHMPFKDFIVFITLKNWENT